MKNYLIVGRDLFGSALAADLHALGQGVLVVKDAAAEPLEAALEACVPDCAVVALAGEPAACSEVLAALRSRGIGRIVCEARDEQQRSSLLQLGADLVVLPEQDMAALLARRLQEQP